MTITVTCYDFPIDGGMGQAILVKDNETGECWASNHDTDLLKPKAELGEFKSFLDSAIFHSANCAQLYKRLLSGLDPKAAMALVLTSVSIRCRPVAGEPCEQLLNDFPKQLREGLESYLGELEANLPIFVAEVGGSLHDDMETLQGRESQELDLIEISHIHQRYEQ